VNLRAFTVAGRQEKAKAIGPAIDMGLLRCSMDGKSLFHTRTGPVGSLKMFGGQRMWRHVTILLAMLIGVVLCGLVPAIVVGWAFGGLNAQKQAELGLPGGDHGFGVVFVAFCMFALGGTLGAVVAVLGALLGSHLGMRAGQGAEGAHQRAGGTP
jgi:hypothetical protein